MGGFAGFYDPEASLLEEKYLWMALARRMAQRIQHRGPDGKSAHVSARCALAHVHLAIADPQSEVHPMLYTDDAFSAAVAYDGEIFNANALREELSQRGFTFESSDDAEVILKSYLCFGSTCAGKFNGNFAFVIDDMHNGRILLCRDRFGVKPLFYTFSADRLVFASEIKSLLEYPGVKPVIGRTGLCEIFGLGMTRTPGYGVLENIREILPGHIAVYDRNGFSQFSYFRLEALPYTEDYDTSVQKVRELLEDIVSRQSNVGAPLCMISSDTPEDRILEKLLAKEQAAFGRPLHTYTFPSEKCMESPVSETDAERYITVRHTPSADKDRTTDFLLEAIIARDLPGTADLDASGIRFFRKIRKQHTVAVSGACADFVFGASSLCFEPSNTFTSSWIWGVAPYASYLKPEVADALQLEEYTQARFWEMQNAVPVLRGESAENRYLRSRTFFQIYRLMASILERIDRCSMYSGLTVRLPYTDHRLVSYLFNIPKAVRMPKGRKNGLLWDAFQELQLISDTPVLHTNIHAQGFQESAAANRFIDILRDSEQPIHRLLSAKACQALLRADTHAVSQEPRWRMTDARLCSYLYEVNLWLVRYKVRIEL